MKPESFESIYQEYFDPVYRYALSLTGDANAAEEITQETFFKAMRSLERFRGDSSVKSWLCSIARNTWISGQRKRRPLSLENAENATVEDGDPETSILRHDESLYIHRLVHDLQEPYREVFILRTLGQLRFRDIGELFGKSENWACVIYHRARARIKDKMEGLQ